MLFLRSDIAAYYERLKPNESQIGVVVLQNQKPDRQVLYEVCGQLKTVTTTVNIPVSYRWGLSESLRRSDHYCHHHLALLIPDRDLWVERHISLSLPTTTLVEMPSTANGITPLTEAEVPLRTGPPTREELAVYYPAKFTWIQIKTFINSG